MTWIPAIALAVGVTALAAMGWAAMQQVDGDGMLSFEAARALYPGLTEAQFRELDTDGDGMLSRNEIEAAKKDGRLSEG